MAISKRRKRKFLPSEVVINIFARLPLETFGNVMLVNKFCLKLISNLKQTKMAIPHLPPEILTDIFARLPVETLSKVILVNKFCLRLISSRDFARAHLKYSKQGKTTDLSAYRCILRKSVDYRLLKQTSYASLLSDSCPINVFDLDYPKNGLRMPNVRFEGSCDGLVCLVLNHRYVFLWNPCTGKYKKLPRINHNFDCTDRYISFTYGLGYNESYDDFKVVAFCSTSYGTLPKDWSSYQIYVFSLKSNSWRKAYQHLKCNGPGFSPGKLISGKLHWLSGGESNRDDTKKIIISFNLKNGMFGIVKPPSNFKDGWCDMTLDVLDGCICLLIGYEERPHVDLWVLTKYGVNESWTKVVTISCVGIPNYFRYFKATVLQNGDILFHSFGSFAVYDPKECSFRFPGTRKLDQICCESVFYVPSLVSPFG